MCCGEATAGARPPRGPCLDDSEESFFTHLQEYPRRPERRSLRPTDRRTQFTVPRKRSPSADPHQRLSQHTRTNLKSCDDAYAGHGLLWREVLALLSCGNTSRSFRVTLAKNGHGFSFNSVRRGFPALNRGPNFAGTETSSPVRGLWPILASRDLATKDPNPRSSTRRLCSNASTIVRKIDSTPASATSKVRPGCASSTFCTNSDRTTIFVPHVLVSIFAQGSQQEQVATRTELRLKHAANQSVIHRTSPKPLP